MQPPSRAKAAITRNELHSNRRPCRTVRAPRARSRMRRMLSSRAGQATGYSRHCARVRDFDVASGWDGAMVAPKAMLRSNSTVKPSSAEGLKATPTSASRSRTSSVTVSEPATVMDACTPGNFREKAISKFGRNVIERLSTTAMFTCPRVMPFKRASKSIVPSWVWLAACKPRSSSTPASVKARLRVWRSNRAIPNCASSNPICRLMAEAATLSWRDAARTEPSVATATK